MADSLNPCSSDGGPTYCIFEPPVTVPSTDLPAYVFPAGSVVTVSANGCVQTGGRGSTWKRYVDPRGPNSDRLYHGKFGIRSTDGTLEIPLQRFQLTPITFTLRWAGHLVLGYEDDNYSDNGYYAHDDGNPTQCRQTSSTDFPNGPAYVQITVSPPGSEPPPPPPQPACPSDSQQRPFNLLAAGRGPNGEPLNPEFNWQCNYRGSDNTSDFPEMVCTVLSQNGRPCTDQITETNVLNNLICSIGSPHQVHGHLNYGFVSYTGRIYFQDYSLGGFQDNDWNFLLDTSGSIPQPLQVGDPSSPGVSKGNSLLKMEFNGHEIMGIARYNNWWDTEARKALARRARNPIDGLDGHDAVAFGLLGFDARHLPAGAEVHPVLGLAIRESDPTVPATTADKWAVFARNWGNEGGCGPSIEHFRGQRESLLLTLPDQRATARVVSSTASKSVGGMKVLGYSAFSGGAALTFLNGSTMDAWAGEVVLDWSQAPPRGHVVTPPAALDDALSPEPDSPEAITASLFDNLPTATQANLQSAAPLPTEADPPTEDDVINTVPAIDPLTPAADIAIPDQLPITADPYEAAQASALQTAIGQICHDQPERTACAGLPTSGPPSPNSIGSIWSLVSAFAAIGATAAVLVSVRKRRRPTGK